eukprot:6585138-Alexandrium_andersonii.AAC.1
MQSMPVAASAPAATQAGPAPAQAPAVAPPHMHPASGAARSACFDPSCRQCQPQYRPPPPPPPL